MKSRRPLLVAVALLGVAAVAGAALLGAGGEARPSGLVVFTQVPVGADLSPEALQFPESSRIAAVDLDDPEAGLRVLTVDFTAARAPAIDFEGRRMAFAARRNPGGPWQIWEMDLASGDARLLTPDCTHCIDPVYLADDRVAYAGAVADDFATSALYVVDRTGHSERITFHPGKSSGLTLLGDGRILFQLDGALWAVRHDGTGAERMKSAVAGSSVSRARETHERWVVLSSGGRLVRFSQAYPAAPVESVYPLETGPLASAAVSDAERLIAAMRADGMTRYGLWMLHRDGVESEHEIETDAEFHALEPVRAVPTLRPLGFVSIVEPTTNRGGLYCIDANRSQVPAADSATSVRVSTAHGLLGQAPLEPDGSFNLDLPADTPLRFETLDRQGRVVRGPSEWLWVRPGEVRGCVGCHADRALAPPNVVPLAVTKEAVPLEPITFVEAGL